MPAMKGNAPQIPHPVNPKKKSFKDSCLNCFLFFEISLKKNGIKVYNTKNAFTNGVATMAVAMILSFYRKIIQNPIFRMEKIEKEKKTDVIETIGKKSTKASIS